MSKEVEELGDSVEGNSIVLATGTLTVAEQKSADTRYKERVEYFHGQTRSILKDVLRFHWEEGKFVEELFSDPRHWGNRTAEQFAKDMNVSKELAYAYRRFHLRFTEEELKEAVDVGISWHNIFFLLSVDDKTKRRQLMLDVSKGKITNQELQEKVKGTNKSARKEAADKGQKVDKRGGTTAKTVLRSTTTMCFDIVRKLPEYKEAYKAFQKLDDSPRKTEMSKFVKDCRKALEKTRDQINKALELTLE